MAKADEKPLTKTQIINGLAETTELSKKDIIAVLEAMTGQIEEAVAKKWAGCIHRSRALQDLCQRRSCQTTS